VSATAMPSMSLTGPAMPWWAGQLYVGAPMAHLFTFNSGQFREADEHANPINPIAGEGVLTWLAAQLSDRGFEVGPPDAEDWGWYTHVVTRPRTYLLGASGEWEQTSARTDWTVQLDPSRSL
jgi:hypothetical protein